MTILGILCLASGALCAQNALAQEEKKPAGIIQITFLPPPLEHATYSLGIFDARNGKLVRHLQEFAPEKEFTVGLNGLITGWDGKDDAGKPVPAGRYAARGYAVGTLKIEGVDILGNDWAATDEKLRVKSVESVALVPKDDGLGVLALFADGSLNLLRLSGKDGSLVWSRMISATPAPETLSLVVNSDKFAIYDATELALSGTEPPPVAAGDIATGSLSHQYTPQASSIVQGSGNNPAPALTVRMQNSPAQLAHGKGGTVWAVHELGLTQTSPDGDTLRKLETKPNDPAPVAVCAAPDEDRVYLLEETSGWQRVRGLSWVETKEENGHSVSTWQTFFERNIRLPETAESGSGSTPVEINLDENPLSPGKSPKIRVVATFDSKGSYLTTAGGLRLRRVSERPNLQSVHLAKGKPPSPLDFFQYDGAATDEFSITGVHRIMEFDAGEFELTATGEKPADPKTAEPPDL